MLPRAETYRGHQITWLVNAAQNVALIQACGADFTWPELTSSLEEGMTVLRGRAHAAIDAAVDVQAHMEETASRIGAPSSHLPAIGASRQDGSLHIEITDQFHLVARERGQELQRRSTTDVDELLYWVFASATSAMASDWERRHGRPGDDSRRHWFSRQVELLASLSPHWAERKTAEHRRILNRYPLADD